MSSEKKYQIIIGSPLDYEELVAYINIEGKDVALLNQDEGPDKLKLEFFEEPKVKEVDYFIFIEALKAAKKELLLED
jgi:hypothetical protein